MLQLSNRSVKQNKKIKWRKLVLTTEDICLAGDLKIRPHFFFFLHEIKIWRGAGKLQGIVGFQGEVQLGVIGIKMKGDFVFPHDTAKREHYKAERVGANREQERRKRTDLWTLRGFHSVKGCTKVY